ncbi:hypothetical protein KIN20_020001 [Parelaphostrongylus tenuis]|uniref:Uncharacterized protein n=1 Tax=Parelaphostrongylus tenuis TaxID=148309 RepID=A0AAD5QVC2_PARTN|nr:hypothetical protein KIN20_020001 [Parelaphostrongylus tenuis]
MSVISENQNGTNFVILVHDKDRHNIANADRERHKRAEVNNPFLCSWPPVRASDAPSMSPTSDLIAYSLAYLVC